MASVYFCAVTSSSGTYALIQDNDVFMVIFPFLYFPLIFCFASAFLELLQEADIVLI